MNFKTKFALMMLTIFTAACSSLTKGTLLGTTVGLGVGGIVANNQREDAQKNTSLAVGALIGGAIGYFASEERIKKEREQQELKSRNDIAPTLNRPEVRRLWVPDQISGDEFISGHWKYIIDKPAVFSKEK